MAGRVTSPRTRAGTRSSASSKREVSRHQIRSRTTSSVAASPRRSPRLSWSRAEPRRSDHGGRRHHRHPWPTSLAGASTAPRWPPRTSGRAARRHGPLSRQPWSRCPSSRLLLLCHRSRGSRPPRATWRRRPSCRPWRRRPWPRRRSPPCNRSSQRWLRRRCPRPRCRRWSPRRLRACRLLRRLRRQPRRLSRPHRRRLGRRPSSRCRTRSPRGRRRSHLLRTTRSAWRQLGRTNTSCHARSRSRRGRPRPRVAVPRTTTRTRPQPARRRATRRTVYSRRAGCSPPPRPPCTAASRRPAHCEEARLEGRIMPRRTSWRHRHLDVGRRRSRSLPAR